LLALGVLAAGCALAPPALAGDPLTGEVAVNTFTAGNQDGGTMGAGGGQYVVVWSSSLQDTGAEAIYARRFDAGGTPMSEGEIHVNTPPSQNTTPAVAVAPDGRFAIAWTRFVMEENVILRFFAADGTPASTEIPVTTTGAANDPALAMAADGSVVVAWDDNEHDVLARRYGPNGAMPSGVIPLATTPLNETSPRLAMQPGGGFVAVWNVLSPGDNDDTVIGRFAASGSPLTTPGLIGADLDHREGPAVVATAADGSVVAAWTVGNASSRTLWRRFAPDLAPTTEATPANAGTDADHDVGGVGVADDGSVVIGWEHYFTTGSDAQLRSFASDGTPLSADTPVNPRAGYNPITGVAMQPDGRFAVTWTGDGAAGDGDGEGVFARFYASGAVTGAPAPPPPPPPSQQSPVTATPRRPARLSARSIVKLPNTKRCVSRSRFRIHLKIPKSLALASATVVLNGKRVKIVKGRRLSAAIDLRGLPKGTFTVAITLKAKDGRSSRTSRRYHTCARKRR
jgi:hypothetical protein